MIDATAFPQAVLSQRFGEAIGGRRVRSAVFITFSFDPGFFELQVLPLLFSQSFGQVDKVRLLQLEDALRGIDHLAVYYDRAALSQDAEPARLDYRRIDVHRRTGAFHPKLAFLLLDDPDAETGGGERRDHRQSLLVACMSANLTRAGWWENVECAHIEEITDRDRGPEQISYRRDLLALLRRIRGCAGQDDDHRALNAMHTFLRDRVSRKQHANARAAGRWRTRVFGGEGRLNLADWLAELRLGGGDWNLEVISPYFDGRGSAPLQRLIAGLRPRETRVYLPRDPEGQALVTEDAYRATAELEGVRWAALWEGITRRAGGASGERLAPRRLHAKAYRLWNADGRDVVLAGSVNCTSVGHGHGAAGNLEAAFLIDISHQALPRRWWLEPLEREAEQFVEGTPEEGDGLERPKFGVSVRYHWGEGTLRVRLDDAVAVSFDVTDVSGRQLFRIDRADAGEWCDCGRDAADAVRKSLNSSSFLIVRCSDASWRILVREEGMAHRPSILSELSPEEILEYWALLSAEERAAFIERHGAFGEGLEGLPAAQRNSPEAGGTMFDRFAGVFHAFECLRRHMEASLKDERYDDAEMRLLGAKYDSLRELLRKTLERADGDAVLSYITFLTAKQLRDSLEYRYPTFFGQREPLVRKLDRLIADGIKRRAEVFPGEDAEVGAFLDWFEPAFLEDLGHL